MYFPKLYDVFQALVSSNYGWWSFGEGAVASRFFPAEGIYSAGPDAIGYLIGPGG